MFQSWRHLLFLHWKADPDLLQAQLPPGLEVDCFGGDAFVGVVPFFMCGVRPRFLPCMPGLSNFLELNVRIYVHDEDGVPGVWFFSLDANCAPAVWVARTFFKLPYRHAKMRARVEGDGWVDYRSRCGAGSYDWRFRYRGTGEPQQAEPGTLEFFLLERYYLYAFDPRRKRLLRGQVAHTPYQFQSAEVDNPCASPVVNQGVAVEGEDPVHLCFSPGVTVEVLGLEQVRPS